MKCPTCKEVGLVTVEDRAIPSGKVVDALWCPFCGTYIDNTSKAHVPARSPYAQSIGVKEIATHFATGIHQGLLIVAADALERANKLLSTKAALPLVAEAITEALAATVHELDAQGEDIADIVVTIGDEHPGSDPDRIRDLLRRTLRRRRAKQ